VTALINIGHVYYEVSSSYYRFSFTRCLNLADEIFGRRWSTKEKFDQLKIWSLDLMNGVAIVGSFRNFFSHVFATCKHVYHDFDIYINHVNRLNNEVNKNYDNYFDKFRYENY